MNTDAENLQKTIEESGSQIAGRLVEFRERAGLSIQQIVDRTGLSRSGIEKMEGYRASPTVRSVELYVTACGRTLSEFFKPFVARNKREMATPRR